MADNETSIKKPPFYIRWFFPILVFLGCLGGFLALTVPLWKTWAATPKTNCIEFIIGWIGSLLSPFIPDHNDEKYPQGKVITDLRLHILYITGGVIAILTLLQTNWKNQVDHRKVEDDIKKNKNDHNRQVHAERRSRYTKAVEQLADEKAPVRLGGIYTLVGLVDEWLTDDTLNPKERKKEGQVIINNLCSYIRSPFPLAEKIEEYEARKELEELKKKEPKSLSLIDSTQLDILNKRFASSNDDKKIEQLTIDYAKIQEEQDVRRTIFVEMSKRSSTFDRAGKGKVVEAISGLWSDFDFDFSRAPVFYPLNGLRIERGNFYSAKFYSDADFRAVTFARSATFREAIFAQNANFSGATFARSATFRETIFAQNATFRSAIFAQNATFKETTFAQNANFMRAIFAQNANFSGATFTRNMIFRSAIFTQNANFSGATFTQNANFSEATFTQNATFSEATFTQNANFSGATFTRNMIFRGATFTQNANFMRATSTQNANFMRATFTQNANFMRATFTQNANFSGATFTKNVDFSDAIFKNHEPIFVRGTLRARFSVRSAQEDYRLEVSENHRSIETEQITVAYPKVFTAPDPKVFTIPAGCELFDPEPLPAPKPEEKPAE